MKRWTRMLAATVLTLIFVPVVGSFMEPRILGGRTGTFYGTIIEDQFVAVFNCTRLLKVRKRENE